MADKSPLAYLPEISQEAIEANRAYQEALAKLTTALDQRKNRFFDPRYLAAAQAFLSPTKTGSFFEALGTAAGAVGQAQEGMRKEDQEIAKLQLDLASQGLGMARQKALMSGYGPFAQAEAPQATEGATEAPGALPPAGAPTPGALGGLDKKKFMQEGALQGIPPAQREVEWTDYQNKLADLRTKGIKVTEGGTYDYGTGQFQPFPSGKTTSVRIFGPGKGIVYENIPESIAARLSVLEPSNPEYVRLANLVLSGGQPAPSPTGPSGGPAATPSGAPPGMIESASDKTKREAREKADLEIATEEQKKYRGKLAEGAAEIEVGLPAVQAASLRAQSAVKSVESAITKSPTFFGIFNRPGLIASIGELVSKGVKTPGGTLELAGFENAVRQSMPNATQADIDNVTRAAANLAEIELAYTQMYLNKQGQITEGERAIVRRLGGTTSDSPATLLLRMNWLKNRSQYDSDRIDTFRRWKEAHPNKTILDFDSSPEAKKLLANFSKKMDKLAGIKPTQKSPSERLDQILGGQ